MASELASGYRVMVDLDLASKEDGGLKTPLRNGNRSLLFVFPAPEPGEEPVRLGAVVEEVDDGHPGARCTARLLFWDELAEVYASLGAKFDIWYSRVVGHGVVKDVLGE